MIAGVYSMAFNIPTLRLEIGEPLDNYIVNHDISPTYRHFRRGGKKIRLLLEGGRIVSWIQKTVSLCEVRL